MSIDKTELRKVVAGLRDILGNKYAGRAATLLEEMARENEQPTNAFVTLRKQLADYKRAIDYRNEVEGKAHALFTTAFADGTRLMHTPDTCDPLGFVKLLRAERERLKAELEATQKDLDAVYKVTGHSTYSSEPVSEAVLRLKTDLGNANRDSLDYKGAYEREFQCAKERLETVTRLQAELEKVQAACAVKQARLSQLLEVAEFIDNEDKHQTKLIKEAMADNCGQPLLDRLARLEKALRKHHDQSPFLRQLLGEAYAESELAKETQEALAKQVTQGGEK